MAQRPEALLENPPPEYDRLCEKFGYMGLKRYFWLDSMTFKQLMNGDDIVKLCLDHYADRVVDIYVEAMSDLIDSQVGSSHLNESETSESEQGSDFTDSDYDMETGDEGGLEDDTAFEKHVDRGVEWEGIDEGTMNLHSFQTNKKASYLHLNQSFQHVTIELAADCVPIKSNEFHYEVGTWLGSSKYTVDLGKHTCSCRKWDLSGIPCQHAMSAICSQVKDPEDYVHEYYWVDTYHKVYEHAIYPINGSSLWKEMDYLAQTPNEGRAAGRPPSARRMEPGEPARKQKKKAPWHGTRLKRQQSTIRCRVCGQTSGAANEPLHEDIDMADAPISQPQSDPPMSQPQTDPSLSQLQTNQSTKIPVRKGQSLRNLQR
ncbi:hypothetical protein BUALT_Bualt09G0052600 [Buddleja alternifolia]|uniref:SWIM-type domain-containing protein n=1 Tax=Buddleja alternifolia TaxID=168488 RepID=A0AAV6X7F6_9LAMI|nr:hypothetical protein BUALT_Bualt09G0052600 [Buddleja alternifolia]